MPLEPRSQELPLRFGLDLTEDPEGQPQGALQLENFDWDREGVLIRRPGFVVNRPLGLERPTALVKTGNSFTVLTEDRTTLDLSTITTLYPGMRVHQVTAASDVQDEYTLIACTVLNEDETLPADPIADWEYQVFLFLVRNSDGQVLTEIPLETGVGAWGVRVTSMHQTGVPGNRLWGIYYMFHVSGTQHDLRYRAANGTEDFQLVGLSPTTVYADAGCNDGETMPLDTVVAADRLSTYLSYYDSGGAAIVDRRSQSGAVLATAGVGSVDMDRTYSWLCLLASGNLVLARPDDGVGGGFVSAIVLDSALNVVVSGAVISDSTTTGCTRLTMVEYDPDQVLFAWNESDDALHYVYADVATVITPGVETLYEHTLIVTQMALLQMSTSVKHAALGVSPRNALDSGNPNITVLGLRPVLPGELPVVTAPTPLGLAAFDEAGLWQTPFVEFFGSLHTQGLPPWVGTGDLRRLPVLVNLQTGTGPAIENGFGYVYRIRFVQLTARTARRPVITSYLQDTGFASGALLSEDDGSRVVPAAFLGAPEPPVLASGGVGNRIGLYAYVVVWEYTDVRGNIQSSPPSLVSTFTAASQKIQVTCYTRTIGFHGLAGQPIRLKLYRTASGGSTFNLVYTTVLDTQASMGADDTAVFLDNETDDIVARGETPYSIGDPGGALTAQLTPPLAHVCAHRNRLVGIRSDVPETIVFTGEVFEPLAPLWNNVLSFRVDNQGGPPLAVASLVDKIVVLQHDQIAVVSGEGPDLLGTGAFSFPEVIARGVGVEPTQIGSVVETPAGVMFAHRTGIYLLQPDLQLVPIGRALGGKNFGSEHPIHRARYLPSRSQVWFLAEDIVYVFDLRFQRWTTFAGDAWGTLIDIIEHQNVVYALPAEPDGDGAYQLLELSTTVYVDEDYVEGGTNRFTQTLGLPWFRVDRAQELRLWKVFVTGSQDGSLDGRAEIVLTTYTQDERRAKASNVPDNTYTWTAAQIAAEPDNFLLKARQVSQRCRAFRVTLTVAPVDTHVEGPFYALSAVTYDFGVLPGRGKTRTRAQAA